MKLKQLAWALPFVMMACNNSNKPVTKAVVDSHVVISHIDTSLHVDSGYVCTGFYLLADEKTGIKMICEGNSDTFFVSKTPFAAVNQIVSTKIDGEELCLTFNGHATKKIAEISRSANKIAVVITNRLLFVVSSEGPPATRGIMCIWMGGHTKDEVYGMQEMIAVGK